MNYTELSKYSSGDAHLGALSETEAEYTSFEHGAKMGVHNAVTDIVRFSIVGSVALGMAYAFLSKKNRKKILGRFI